MNSLQDWAEAPRTICSGGEWARDNAQTLRSFERICSLRPHWREILIAEAESNWAGNIVSAVLEAQDGHVAGIEWREARKFFRNGWELTPATPEERAARIESDRLAAERAGAERAAAKTVNLVSNFAPHQKYDDCAGSGVW